MSDPAKNPAAVPAPRIAVIRQGIAYLDPAPTRLNAYHACLNVLGDDEWFLSYDLGTSTESLDYHTRGLRTLDAGKSWRDEGPFLPRPDFPPTTHTIRTRRLTGRRILGFGKWEDRRGYETQRSNRETLGQVPMQLFWIDSPDGGKSWSAPRWIQPPLEGPTWELCHAIIELPDHSWAAPVAMWRDWQGHCRMASRAGCW